MDSIQEFEDEHYAWDFKTQSNADDPRENRSPRSTGTCRRYSGISQKFVWPSGFRLDLSSGTPLFGKTESSEVDPNTIETHVDYSSCSDSDNAENLFGREFQIDSDSDVNVLRQTGRRRRTYKLNPLFTHAPKHIKPNPRSFLPVFPSLQSPFVGGSVEIDKLNLVIGINPLRRPYFNSNGPLPDDYQSQRDMEENATQQATQPFMDQRRDGRQVMVNEMDEGDVICILHPASVRAYRAVERIAEATPQHILISRIINQTGDQDSQAEIQHNGPKGQRPTKLRSVGSGKKVAGEKPGLVTSKDIALRFSSRLRNPCMGFVFGRVANKCDLMLVSDDRDTENRISGSHFRIFFNHLGVLMLEDTSVNGTHVNEAHLKISKKDTKRMIAGGEIIKIQQSLEDDGWMNFIVTIPPRHSPENPFGQNLAKYMAWVDQEARQAEALAQAAIDGRRQPIPPVHIPFNPFNNSIKDLVPSGSEDFMKMNLAIKKFNHGMEWSGGDRFNVVGHIGRGAFANVFKLATKRDGEYYAAKQIEKRHFMKNNTVDSKIHNEIDIMKRLCHPNIVQFIEHQDEPHHLYIIMEFVPGGDLTSFIRTGTAMAEYMCQSVAEQICDAVKYLHERNVTHRDIKPDNILIQTRDPLVVKLSDFGLSKWVADEETFLKSFCGTLLYCAPEIYPGYGLYKAGIQGKRARNKNTPLKTSPYKPSVDTWALGAVLYHLLCGTPPFRGGSSDDRGSSMLDIVMTQRLDIGRLQNAGVSKEGIDFVSKMVVVDPAGRWTETELLKHPWIIESGKTVADDVQMKGGANVLDSIDECGSDLDASQLSLVEIPLDHQINDSEDGSNKEADETEGGRESKRFKVDEGGLHPPRSEGVSTAHISDPHFSGDPTESVYSEPVLPPTAPAGRLFGEIGESALRSSGILGHDAHAALQMPLEESHDESFDTSESWVEDAQIISEKGALSAARYSNAQRGLPSMGAAPSLFGAEALVGQLKMTSLGSGGSASSSQSTIEIRRQDSKSRDATVVPGRPISGSRGSRGSSQTPKSFVDHTKSRTTKLSGSEGRSNRNHSKSALIDDGNQSVEEELRKPASQRSSKLAIATAPETSSESGGESRDETESSVDPTEENNMHAQERPSQHGDRSTSVSDGSQVFERGARDATSPLSFPKPPPRFGTLTALPGSLCSTVIRLEQRITYYGRDPSSHVQHTDPQETRIPKNALDIIFWRPGIEAMIDNGKEWSSLDGLYAIVHTRTSKSIRVNGVKLTKGENCWNYGRLHTGDIITIFEEEAEFLKFRCEFSLGLSAQARPADQPRFVVEKEKEKYEQNQTRQSMSAASRDSKSTT